MKAVLSVLLLSAFAVNAHASYCTDGYSSDGPCDEERNEILFECVLSQDGRVIASTTGETPKQALDAIYPIVQKDNVKWTALTCN